MPEKKTTTAAKAKTTAAKKAPAKTTTTATKATPRKTTTRAKTTTTKTAATQVAANARHIEENALEIKNNSKMIHILYGTIIVLMMIIAGLAFYVGQMLGNGSNSTIAAVQEDVVITVIDDVRCTECQADAIVTQLQTLPFLANAEFVMQDFSDSGVEDFVIENAIVALPAVILNTNNLNDAGQVSSFLTALPGGQYSLALGATFDPFATRSDKGFLVLDDVSVIESIRAESPIDGNPDAAITYIEYSDLECPYCAQLHNNGTPKELSEKYGDDMNIIFQHFPLDFHPNALPAAQALECVNEQGVDTYALIDASFAKYNSNNFSLDGFYDLAVEAGADKTSLEECVASGKYEEKALAQQTTGQSVFGVTGTPGNVLINNQTGEYEVISGAFPASAFEEVIDRMLAE